MELTTSQSNEDLGFAHNQAPFAVPPPRFGAIKLTRLKVNLSTPLTVKTANGESMAGPGDVVGRVGRNDVLMSKDLFIALLGRAKYDDLVKKEMLKIRITKRFDDALAPFTDEQLDEQRAEIDRLLEEIPPSEPPDPNDINVRVQVTDSRNGPPTSSPKEFATIIPGPMLPVPDDFIEEDSTEPDKGVSTDPAPKSDGYANPFSG